MSFPNQEENVPVRNFFDPNEMKEDTGFTKDEEDESTIRRVYKMLKDANDDLDRWHAFTAEHRKMSDLKLKQDIHAHEMAAIIIGPALEAVEQAVATIDEKFRQRMQK